jgi:hypothetical protein
MGDVGKKVHVGPWLGGKDTERPGRGDSGLMS